MLTQQMVQVQSLGEDVQLEMGNCQWRMHYEAALSLSTAMRKSAKVAKIAAGDMSRTIGVTGTLHDAEKGINHGQPHTPNGVRKVKDMTTANKMHVKTEGTLVLVKLGATEVKMPYQAAFTISQWIRLRAKESKQRAGDLNRHWSAILTPVIH